MNNWSENSGFVLVLILCLLIAFAFARMPSKDRLLITAAERGDTNVIVRLIREGASVNAKTRATGVTPLMAASSKGHSTSVNLLLRLGANKADRDEHGNTALQHALLNGFTNLAGVLNPD